VFAFETSKKEEKNGVMICIGEPHSDDRYIYIYMRAEIWVWARTNTLEQLKAEVE
jgi:hypothetical protein